MRRSFKAVLALAIVGAAFVAPTAAHAGPSATVEKGTFTYEDGFGPLHTCNETRVVNKKQIRETIHCYIPNFTGTPGVYTEADFIFYSDFEWFNHGNFVVATAFHVELNAAGHLNGWAVYG